MAATTTTTTLGSVVTLDESQVDDFILEAEAQMRLDAQGEALYRAAIKAKSSALRKRPEELYRRYAELAAIAASGLGPEDFTRLCGDEVAYPEEANLRYRREDVLGWAAHAQMIDGMQGRRPRLGPKTILSLHRIELVPNAPFRERFNDLEERGEMTPVLLARALGLEIDEGGGDTRADQTTALRWLGREPNWSRGVPSVRIFVSYDEAVRLAEALALDFYDLGI